VCLTYGHFFLTSALITTCYTVKIRRTGSFYLQSGKVIPYGRYKAVKNFAQKILTITMSSYI